MGSEMAAHLVRAQHDVIVWNRTPAKTAKLADLGADVADSLEALAGSATLIFLCLRGSEDVEEVVRSLAPHAEPGTLIVDHSTIAPQVARSLADELKAGGLRFVDAPITGGSMGAKNGTLTIFCGGSEEDIATAQPFMAAYSHRAERVGDVGSGQLMKLANQIAVGGSLLALCECLSFAQKAGLDVAQARELIGGGAGGSWSFEHYGPKILARDWTPGFSVDNQLKDFVYCAQAAAEADAAIPTTLLAQHLLQLVRDLGQGANTTAILYELLLSLGFEE